METPTNYTCKNCNQTLPLTSFYTGPSYSRYPYSILPYCKPCKRSIHHARMSKTVVNKHGVALNGYQIAMYKHRGANPDDIGGFKCEKHPNSRWHFHGANGMWRCNECESFQRTHPLNRPDKMERLRKYAELKAGAWGERAVEMLLAELVSGKKLRLDKLWVAVKIKLYTEAFGRPGQVRLLERWSVLNHAAGKPGNNVGWTCQHCEIHSDDVRFFDIDHVVPRSKGGPDTYDNMQVLCPSCHRLKSIADADNK